MNTVPAKLVKTLFPPITRDLSTHTAAAAVAAAAVVVNADRHRVVRAHQPEVCLGHCTNCVFMHVLDVRGYVCSGVGGCAHMCMCRRVLACCSAYCYWSQAKCAILHRVFVHMRVFTDRILTPSLIDTCTRLFCEGPAATFICFH